MSEGEVNTIMTQNPKEKAGIKLRRSPRQKKGSNTDTLGNVRAIVQVLEAEKEPDSGEDSRLAQEIQNAENAHRVQDLAIEARKKIDWEDSDDDSTTDDQQIDAMISGTKMQEDSHSSAPSSLQQVIDQRHLPDAQK